MATVHITLSQVGGVALSGTEMPVANSIPIAADTLATSAISAQSSITASTDALAGKSAFWTVTATGNVYVRFGSNPTAVTDAGWLILAGQTRDFAVTATGEKVAVIDA